MDETTAALDVAFGEAWRAELTLDAGTTRALGSGCVASVFRYMTWLCLVPCSLSCATLVQGYITATERSGAAGGD